jgi:hypothetical protein
MRLRVFLPLILLCLGSGCKGPRGITSEEDVREFFAELGAKEEQVMLLESRDVYARSDGSSRSMFIGKMHKFLRSNPQLKEALEKSDNDIDRRMRKDLQEMGSGLEVEWE